MSNLINRMPIWLQLALAAVLVVFLATVMFVAQAAATDAATKQAEWEKMYPAVAELGQLTQKFCELTGDEQAKAGVEYIGKAKLVEAQMQVVAPLFTLGPKTVEDLAATCTAQ